MTQTTIPFLLALICQKKKFDACIINDLGKKMVQKVFIKSPDCFDDFLTWVSSHTNTSNVLFIMEHIGIYSRLLWFYLQDNSCNLVMESDLKINRSVGIKRGKNDKLDSYVIANYGFGKQHTLQLTHTYNDDLFVLDDLLANRRRLKDQLKAIEVPLKEYKEKATKKTNDLLQEISKSAIESLNKSLKAGELAIDKLITENEALEENTNYGSSIKGISKIMMCWMIVYTRNFCAEFSARKFASLAGIAPFEFSSGTSINRGNQVVYLN